MIAEAVDRGGDAAADGDRAGGAGIGAVLVGDQLGHQQLVLTGAGVGRGAGIEVIGAGGGGREVDLGVQGPVGVVIV